MKWVLLLEDEPLQVKLVTDLLRVQLSLPVRATEFLSEALLMAKENPTLIISDIVLVKPTSVTKDLNRDGIKFAQAIKSSAETAHLPLLLRSSLPLADFGVTLEETKANNFLNKTASSEEFLRIVRGLAEVSN